MRKAFITGITGQDGRHLAEFLHGKGYKVFGMMKGQHNPRAELLRDEFPYKYSPMSFTTWVLSPLLQCRSTRPN